MSGSICLSDIWCLIFICLILFKEKRFNLELCFFSRSFMECCERFAVLGFNLAWPSLLLCCLKDKSSPLFIFSCFKKQPVRQAGLGRLRGSLQFWHFNLRVIGARSGSQSVRDTLCFILQTSGPSPRLNLLAMKPNQRVIYKSLQSQLKCRDWDYGGGERRVSIQLRTSDDCNNLTCVSNHQSGSSSLLSLGSSEMSGVWATSIDCILTNELGWMNKSFRLLIRGMCSGVTFNLLDKYFQQQGNH